MPLDNLMSRATIEEGGAASKSPHSKFGYFLSVSQQAVSANISKNSAVGNIMQYLNHEYLNEYIYSPRKGFKNVSFSNLKI